MPKRRADDPDVETAIQSTGIKDDDWLQKLLEVDKDELILIVSLIVNKAISTTEVSRGLELNSHPSLQQSGLTLLRELVSLKILAISSLKTTKRLSINFLPHSTSLSSRIHGAHKTSIKRWWNRHERKLESWTQYVKDTEVHAHLDSLTVYFDSILFASCRSFRAESLTCQKRLCQGRHSQQGGKSNIK
jgi:hypothetical protein